MRAIEVKNTKADDFYGFTVAIIRLEMFSVNLNFTPNFHVAICNSYYNFPEKRKY